MCFLARCEVCGELMDYEDYYSHTRSCKPELEKVEVPTTKVERKKKVK